jgi:transposase
MDESGFSEAAVVRRTWAPRGPTPVLHPRGRNLHWMSAMGAIAYHRRSGRARLLLLFQRGAVRSAGVLRFLRHLRRHVQSPVVLLWDGLKAHHSAEVRAWIEQQTWLTVERLPAYAPELNPVEGLWAWLKGTCLANVCIDELDPLVARVRNGAQRVRRRQDLLKAFIAKAGLSL